MKRLFALLLVGGLFVGTFSSCQKCETCKAQTIVTDADGNVVSDATSDGGEVCSTESIEAWEATSTEATTAGITTTVIATCE